MSTKLTNRQAEDIKEFIDQCVEANERAFNREEKKEIPATLMFKSEEFKRFVRRAKMLVDNRAGEDENLIAMSIGRLGMQFDKIVDEMVGDEFIHNITGDTNKFIESLCMIKLLASFRNVLDYNTANMMSNRMISVELGNK